MPSHLPIRTVRQYLVQKTVSEVKRGKGGDLSRPSKLTGEVLGSQSHGSFATGAIGADITGYG